MNEIRSRGVISHFLKTRRARLRPEDVGLPLAYNRRIAGLRREEVAALAGVGDTWYGLFESGKPIRVSERVVQNVGRALRLQPEELLYLTSLVAADSPSTTDFSSESVDPLVVQTVDAIAFAPAFIIGPRLDYLAFNNVMRALYRVPDAPSDIHKNLMLRVFLDPNAHALYPAWEDSARRATSKFRRTYGRHVGNASFEALLARLSAHSADFRRLWELHDVGTLHDPITDALQHPAIGSFRFRLQAFDVPGTLAQTLVVMLPLTPADEAAVATLATSLRMHAPERLATYREPLVLSDPVRR